MAKINSKLYLASKIREKKNVLFGKISDKTTNEAKWRAWQEIFDIAVGYGLISKERGWKHLRDVYWQNMKRSLLTKIEHANILGNSCRFTSVDKVILDIIGKDPAGEENDSSLDLQEQYDNDLSLSSQIVDNQPKAVSPEPDIPKLSEPTQVNPCKKCKRKREKSPRMATYNEDYAKLRKQRLELQIYNLKLSALRMERKLNLPKSEYTADVEEPETNSDDECKKIL